MAKTPAYRTGLPRRPAGLGRRFPGGPHGVPRTGAACLTAFTFVVALSSGCSPSLNYTSGNRTPTAPSGGAPALIGISVSAIDPAGDAPRSDAAPTPPDLVGIKAETDGSIMRFTVTFAPGWDVSRTALDIYLDVDQNPATGLSVDGVGAEYDVQPGAVLVFQGTTTPVVTPTSLTVTPDGMTISFPFGYLIDDGFMNFRVRAHDTQQTAFDSLPDVGLAPVRLD